MNRFALRTLLTGSLAAATLACGGLSPTESLEDQLEEAIAEQVVEGLAGTQGVDLDLDGETLSITTPDGSVQFGSGGAADVPDDFPLPIYPGASVQGSMTGNSNDGRGQFVAMEIPTSSASYDDVKDFYKSALEAKNLEISEINQSSNGERAMMLIGKASDEEGGMVTLAEESDKLVVTVAWGVGQ